MTWPTSSPGRSLLRVPALLLAATALLVPLGRIAYLSLFSRLDAMDDAGYLMLSLQGPVEGHDLYEDAYSQYGPAYHLILGGLFRAFGWPLIHDTARLVSLAIWLGSIALAAAAVFLLTRRASLALASMGPSFLLLFGAANEPLHPGVLLSPLLCGIPIAASRMRSDTRAPLLVIGALGGVAALIKINVGGFMLAAAAFSIIASSKLWRENRTARGVARGALLAVPFVVLARDLHEPWALAYAVLVGAGAFAVTFQEPTRGPGMLGLAWLAIGALASTIPILVTTLALGTAPAALLEGVLLGPLRHPDAFTLPLPLPGWVLVLGAVAVAAGVAVGRRTRRAQPPFGPPLSSAIVRLAGGAIIWIAISGALGPTVPGFAVALPLAWIAAVPRAGSTASTGRLVVIAAAVLQSLHAYPVAGSQVLWAGFPFVFVGALAVADGWRDVRSAIEARSISLRRWAAVLAAFPILAFAAWVAIGPISGLHGVVKAGYVGWPRLGLPGAADVRVAPSARHTLHRLTTLLERRCSTYISLPGLNSFYQFARLEPPTFLNATAWMFLFDAEIQRRVVDRVNGVGDLCVIRNDAIARSWAQGRPVPQRPLVTFIQDGFVTTAIVGEYRLMERPSERGRVTSGESPST